MNNIEIEGIKRAIELAKKSTSEDNKVHPKVGAVIIKDNKIICEAFRGETKPGKHAEYTALCRKGEGLDFKGATLITTLEQCTTRRHGKASEIVPCVLHIVNKGIKKLIVGMIDRNKDVRGKGILYLQDKSKIVVEHFPSKFNEKIRKINKKFIEEMWTDYKFDMMQTKEVIDVEKKVNIEEKLRAFRQERTSKILNNNTALTAYSAPRLLLHLIPKKSLTNNIKFDVNELKNYCNSLFPLLGARNDININVDGVASYYVGEGGQSYVLLFRNGIMEIVDEFLFMLPFKQKLFSVISLEVGIMESLPMYLKLLKEINAGLPIFMGLSLLNIYNYMLSESMQNYLNLPKFNNLITLEVDKLILPEFVINNYDINLEKFLKPCFDMIWNAWGYPKSYNYNESEQWVGLDDIFHEK